MKQKIKNFLIRMNLISSTRRLRALFSKNQYSSAFKDGSMADPSFAVLENTSLCNLKCKMCYVNFPNFKKKGFSLEQWKSIIDHLPKSIKQISLIGGEPFMMKGITDLIKYIDSKGIIPVICTNATLLTEKDLREISKTSAIKHINISIDGRKETHNRIRGVPTAFDNMVRGVNLINKFGGRIESVTCVIQDENFNEIDSVIRIMHELKIKSLLIEFERRYNHQIISESLKILGMSSGDIEAKDSTTLFHKFSEDEIRSSLDRVEKLAKKNKISIEYLPNDFRNNLSLYLKRRYRNQNKDFVCGYLPVIRVDCEGNVINCPVIRKKMGNLLYKDFSLIWNSDEFKDYRKKLLGNNLVPVCDTCFQCKPKSDFRSLIN